MSKDKNKSAAKMNWNGKNGMQDRRNESRSTLPIPDIPPVALTTFDAKDPDTCAPLAEILKLNGYSTVQFSKCHKVLQLKPP